MGAFTHREVDHGDRLDEQYPKGHLVIMVSALTGEGAYLVDRLALVRRLLRAGASRGSIWTTGEMRDVLGAPASGRRLETLAAKFLDAQVVGRE